jgi:hypothetical protein
VCAFVLYFVTLSSNAALDSRLGGLAYYDTEADLTWLADANANWPTLKAKIELGQTN